MSDYARALDLLRHLAGDPTAVFQPNQWEAIKNLCQDRRKRLVVERTGWGKSAVYFVATRMMRDRGSGPTLILSPLLALMRDQRKPAEALGLWCEVWNSDTRGSWDQIEQDLWDDNVDVLFTTPEQLANDAFTNPLKEWLAARINLVVVDEAHTISDWGHGFRPDFKRLSNLVRMLPARTPLLGTTATANQRVVTDIEAFIGDIHTQRGPLARDSIALQTIRLAGYATRMAWLAANLGNLPRSGIIYTLTKRDAEIVTGWLKQQGHAVEAYHSQVKDDDAKIDARRAELERRLYDNEVKALVSTVALGMGLDKPDLGFVVHFQAPDSVVSYYQQVGRAGRDGRLAYGILLMGEEDSEIHQHFRDTAFPDEAHVNDILTALADSDGLRLADLQTRVNLRQGKIIDVLKFLAVEQPSPVMKERIKDTTYWYRTAVEYELPHDRIQILTQKAEREWHEMCDYAATGECLMYTLTRLLDDPYAERCGRCANCRGETLLPTQVARDGAHAASTYTKQTEQPIQPRKQWPSCGMSQFGATGAQNIPTAYRASEGRVLSRWNDAGWGQLVAGGKAKDVFDDALVGAVAEMVEQRWQPDPFPEWIAHIPSRRSPDPVAEFGARLADRLGIPFVPAIRKVRENRQQKEMANAPHRGSNLDNVFEVAAAPPTSGPVLLLDDIVDSGWTFTVAAALLRKAGSGEVRPMALASTASGD